MKLAIRLICGASLAFVVVGLALHLSAADLGAAQSLARDDLASGMLNIGSKLAVLVALIAAFLGMQRAQWGWVAALGVATLATLFSGAVGALTHTGAFFDFFDPLVAALLTLTYTTRTHNLTSVRVH
jgi:hypothetical protein